MLSKEEIWCCLSEIPDPDIPVISITELGLVRNVEIQAANSVDKVIVSITPSYSGCPAMQFFKDEIITTLRKAGVIEVEIKMVYSPAWTTDWISDAAKEKMKKHGISPPGAVSESASTFFCEEKKTCPWCNAIDTKRTTQFGSTPCKALWFCNLCKQPFEVFKCI